MNCVKCGQSFQDDAVFCPYCGKKQVILPRKKHDRRANGLGSVYFDERSKRWIAQIVTSTFRTEDNHVRFFYKRKSFKARTDALKAVADMKPGNDRPAFTVSYYFNAFQNGEYTSLGETKQTAYKIAYNRLKSLWNTPMKDLTIASLQAVFEGVASYYAAKDMKTLLNKLFRLAAADDRTVNHNLPELIVLPKNEETQVEPFTEEEQLQLWISYEEGNADAAIPLIMIYTGMMTGEMRRLSKSMIDLTNKEIIGVGLKTQERKKKAVLLPDDIIPVLEDVIAGAETDLLYPLTKNIFYRRYYKALKTAGIERDLSPYSCRHTTATVLAVHENVAPQTLQRVMRWKSTKMMDRYVTPSDQDARKAVNKI